MLTGDTAYGNGPVRAELAERDVDVLAPFPMGKVGEAACGDDFQIDLGAGTVTCPARHTVKFSSSPMGSRGARSVAPHAPAAH